MNTDPIFYQAHHPEDRERTPLLLVHGAGGSRLHWPGNLRRVPDCRVFALDLPGHGRTGGAGKKQVSGYGKALVEWIDQLDLPPTVIIGHSMGGAIALWTAVHYPAHVCGLVLIGTGGHLPVNPLLLETLADPIQYSTAVEKITRWSFNLSADPGLVEKARQQLLAADPEVLLGDFQACSEYDLRDHLSEIEVPALILVGGEDKMTPIQLSEELDRQIPNSLMEVIPEAGHMVMLEKPQETGDSVKEFLKEIQRV